MALHSIEPTALAFRFTHLFVKRELKGPRQQNLWVVSDSGVREVEDTVRFRSFHVFLAVVLSFARVRSWIPPARDRAFPSGLPRSGWQLVGYSDEPPTNFRMFHG
jgi:hypothetical protein